MTAMEIELAELDDRIRAVQDELDEARAAAEAALARHLLGEPDVEELASSRAIEAWVADEVLRLLHAREVLHHRIAQQLPNHS